MKRQYSSLYRVIRLVLLLVPIVVILTGVLFFVILFILQNFIIVAQEIDYYFYKSSNVPYTLLASLEKQNTFYVNTNSNKTQNDKTYDLSILIGPKLNFQNINKGKTVIYNNSKNHKKKENIHKPQVLYKIVIPKIGVNTVILRKGALKKRMYRGVAIVNAFGRPNKKDKPVILVSHRFGYVWWTPKYRRLNSFYNIDKLRVGDKIFIYWKDKLFKYKVRKTEISSVITNYNHDLIMYSCIDYFNPKRYIVYADKY